MIWHHLGEQQNQLHSFVSQHDISTAFLFFQFVCLLIVMHVSYLLKCHMA